MEVRLDIQVIRKKESFKYVEFLIKEMRGSAMMLRIISMQDGRNGSLPSKLCVIRRYHLNIKTSST